MTKLNITKQKYLAISIKINNCTMESIRILLLIEKANSLISVSDEQQNWFIRKHCNRLSRTRSVDVRDGKREKEGERVQIDGSISILIKMDSRCNQPFIY